MQGITLVHGKTGVPQFRYAAPVVDGAAERHQEGGHQLRQRLAVGRALPARRIALQPLRSSATVAPSGSDGVLMQGAILCGPAGLFF